MLSDFFGKPSAVLTTINDILQVRYMPSLGLAMLSMLKVEYPGQAIIIVLLSRGAVYQEAKSSTVTTELKNLCFLFFFIHLPTCRDSVVGTHAPSATGRFQLIKSLSKKLPMLLDV